ncbi:MAG: class I SAM-dependent methyltransferase, partial [Actinomycetota bacterium]|nr:class I SAM-dependent methyltransferase [Actinomycetota bacterium]
MTWDPVTYPATIRAEVHDYDELQAKVAEGTAGVEARAILDLGIGAGETAKRVLRVHRDAHLVGIDSSPDMLRAGAEALPHERVTFVQQQLSDPLPEQRFDLVISALAIHHLEGEAK